MRFQRMTTARRTAGLGPAPTRKQAMDSFSEADHHSEPPNQTRTSGLPGVVQGLGASVPLLTPPVQASSLSL